MAQVKMFHKLAQNCYICESYRRIRVIGSNKSKLGSAQKINIGRRSPAFHVRPTCASDQRIWTKPLRGSS